MSQKSIKLVRNSDVRRIRLDDLAKADESKAKSKFDLLVNYISTYMKVQEFALKYQDDEGDTVTIANDAELKEALAVGRRSPKLVRISISDLPKPIMLPSTPKLADALEIELQFNKGLKLITVSKKISLEGLMKEIRSQFLGLPQKFSLRYIDDEGDHVSMFEESELREAVDNQQHSPLRVIITPVEGALSAPATASQAKPAPTPVPAPAPQPAYTHVKPATKRWEDVTWEELNASLNALADKGFHDMALNSALLEKYNNDVEAVIAELSAKK